jgi:hypothetical protein
MACYIGIRQRVNKRATTTTRTRKTGKIRRGLKADVARVRAREESRTEDTAMAVITRDRFTSGTAAVVRNGDAVPW